MFVNFNILITIWLNCYLSILTQFNNPTETKNYPDKKRETPSEKPTSRLFDSKVIKPSSEGVSQQLRSSSVSKAPSHADQAIQRWKEKMMNQSQSKYLPTYLIFVPSINLSLYFSVDIYTYYNKTLDKKYYIH